jgi:molecular chaperone DnaJ
VQVLVETPDELDDEQRDLLQQLAVLRDEERPEARLGASHKSVFGRIKDAFR